MIVLKVAAERFGPRSGDPCNSMALLPEDTSGGRLREHIYGKLAKNVLVHHRTLSLHTSARLKADFVFWVARNSGPETSQKS